MCGYSFYCLCDVEEKWDRGAVFDLSTDVCARVYVPKVPFYIYAVQQVNISYLESIRSVA